MAKVINAGYSDTATTATTLARGPLNFGADFRLKVDKSGEMTLVNITSPFDRPEEILMNVSNIANIYDKTSIDPSVHAPNRRGVNLYTKITDIYKVTDDTDPSFEQHLPLSVSIVIRAPQSEYISAAHVQTVLARCVSALYDTGASTTTRLNGILRGALKPSDL